MANNNITTKLFVVALVGGLCIIASFVVLGLVYERLGRFEEARQEVAKTWGESQIISGPILMFNNPSDAAVRYVLPDSLNYQVRLEPEIRSRGIYNSVVYVAKLSGSGSFSAKDIAEAGNSGSVILSLEITDTRGIQKQVDLEWDKFKIPFEPSAGEGSPTSSSGLHVKIPYVYGANHTFAFEINLNGSEGIKFLPLGRETEINISAPWENPKFTGNYLPSERDITPEGFDATWRISSFGRTYPQVFSRQEYSQNNKRQYDIVDSSFGVDLLEGVDLYTQTIRSIKYAILFIATTFIVFVLFELLSRLRIHPVQYLLIGITLTIFYLLLLSLSEHIGFGLAYLISMLMVALLISTYSYKILGSMKKTILVFGSLMMLYGYLYINLREDEYTLLFGSLFLFTLLAIVMYLTRNIDWYNYRTSDEEGNKLIPPTK